VAEVDLRPAEPFWIEGAEGKPLHGFLIKPHGFDETKHYPCILNVHGGPQFQWTDTFRGDWQMYPGSGYVVAFVNPHGSTGYGQAYCDAIRMDYDGKVMTDILRVADYLGSLNFIDDQRMGAMGWSWGGYAMMYLAGIDHPFQSLAAMMGVFDLASMYGSTEELWFVHHDNGGAPWENPDYYRRASPSSRSHQLKTPCLVITGELDYRVPYSQSLQFFTALQRNGVHSRLIVFPNDGHWPHPVKSMPLYYNAHLEWFHATLGGDPAPYVTEELVRQGRIPPTKAAQAPSSHP
jgi:dipeptidyl aminopeptidase/acylaminoacyl peptidase